MSNIIKYIILWIVVIAHVCAVPTLDNPIDDIVVGTLEGFQYTIPGSTFSSGSTFEITSSSSQSEMETFVTGPVGSIAEYLFRHVVSVCASGNYVYLGMTLPYSFVVVDVSSVEDPEIVGVLTGLTDGFYDCVVDPSENWVYIVSGDFRIVNVSTKSAPSFTEGLYGLNSGKTVVVNDSYAYVVDSGIDELLILDISDKNSVILEGSAGVSNAACAVVAGDFAYVGRYIEGLDVVDISVKSSPIVIEFVDVDYGTDLALEGSYLYVAEGSWGVTVLDLANASKPEIMGNIDPGGSVINVYAMVGEYIATLDSSTCGVRVIDVSNKNTPTPYSVSNPSNGDSVEMFVLGTFAYLACGWGGLSIFDISNPASPTRTGVLGQNGKVSSVELYHASDGNRYLYSGNYDEGLTIFNVTNLDSISIANKLEINGKCYEARIQDEYMYVVGSSIGLYIYNISDDPLNPSLVSTHEVSLANKMRVYGDWVYIAREGDGIAIVDVSNKNEPVSSGTIDTTSARDLEVKGNFIFVADYTNGVLAIDMTVKSSLLEIDNVPVSDMARKIQIQGDYAFVSDWSEGFMVIDISNPYDMNIVHTENTGFCAHLLLHGEFMYFGGYYNGFKIYDISDPENPSFLHGVNPLPNYYYDIYLDGNLVYLANWDWGISIIQGELELRTKDSLVMNCGNISVDVTARDISGSVTDRFYIFPNVTCVHGHSYGCIDKKNCSCKERFAGEYCEVCFENYYSEYCNVTSCNGIMNNISNPEICSGHGECILYEYCECDLHWNGTLCESTTCENISSSDLLEVCSGHGECVDYEECICVDYSYYTGKYCQFWTCFTVGMNNITEVCGGQGRGSCIDRDKCYCHMGYSSTTQFGICDEWYCNSIHHTSSDVCSSRGDCIDYDTCQCKHDYEGGDCETWSCGYDYKLTSLTCSGNGKCKKPNTCECKGSHRGGLCETNILYGFVMAPILALSGVSFVVCLLLVFCLICVVCFVGIVLFFISLCVLIGIVVRQRMGMNKFTKLRDFDFLLKEQEMEEDTSVANLKMNKDLYKVNFDDIKIENLIGEGGSNSIVFKAFWRNKIVAFKCFKTRHLCGDQEHYDEFEKEVEILASISHPHIIRFFGATMKPPRVGIIMEFCDSGDLDQFIDSFLKKYHMRYPVKEKCRMIFEIASSLEYLHSRNIIHRDLKLENVLVDSQMATKLMDFGLSKMVDRMSQQKTKKIGTNIYMAPELVLGEGDYDEKCDVFSYGILVWILFTENRSPYGWVSNQPMIELKVANDSKFRPPLEELQKVVSEDCGWVVDLATSSWNHDSGKRKSFLEISDLIHSKMEGLSDDKLDSGWQPRPNEELDDYTEEVKDDDMKDCADEIETWNGKFIALEKKFSEVVKLKEKLEGILEQANEREKTEKLNTKKNAKISPSHNSTIINRVPEVIKKPTAVVHNYVAPGKEIKVTKKQFKVNPEPSIIPTKIPKLEDFVKQESHHHVPRVTSSPMMVGKSERIRLVQVPKRTELFKKLAPVVPSSRKHVPFTPSSKRSRVALVQERKKPVGKAPTIPVSVSRKPSPSSRKKSSSIQSRRPKNVMKKRAPAPPVPSSRKQPQSKKIAPEIPRSKKSAPPIPSSRKNIGRSDNIIGSSKIVKQPSSVQSPRKILERKKLASSNKKSAPPIPSSRKNYVRRSNNIGSSKIMKQRSSVQSPRKIQERKKLAPSLPNESRKKEAPVTVPVPEQQQIEEYDVSKGYYGEDGYFYEYYDENERKNKEPAEEYYEEDENGYYDKEGNYYEYE